MNNKTIYLKQVRDKLDQHGTGMCLAKWKQVTLHLPTGHGHSCHHPKTHLIPIEEIAANPAALHNTSYKKEQRKMMMTGSRPQECHYCWNIEDNTPKDVDDVFSDRTLKSSYEWSMPHYDEVVAAGWNKDVAPSYLEVSFSYGCNFKCAYCSPEISSKWMEEIQQYGGYPTSLGFNNLEHIKFQNKMPIPEKDENPYVDAFWKWWPDIYPTLHTFRITGGEPLMTKHTFRVLDYIIENPNPNLELAINSNCVVAEKLYDKFLEKIKIIQEGKMVKKFTLYTSCEAYGKKAEYIRNGLDYDIWLENCDRFLREIPTADFSIMSTYNALSVTSYVDFLEDVLELKLKYQTQSRSVGIDVPYLDHPKWMNVGILPISYKEYIFTQVEFMRANHHEGKGFQFWEMDKLERIQYLFKDSPELTYQKDFALFFEEHDRRRGTDFLATFPELADFYNYCKSIQ
jgi:hypothetical protein